MESWGQTVWLAIVSLASLGIGWWCKTMWLEVRLLGASLKETQVALPTNYLSKAEYESRMDRYESRMDRLEQGYKDGFHRVEIKIDKIVDILGKKADR